MYVHFDAKLVFLANPRTASRATATVLMRRGFEQVGQHHGVAWGATDATEGRVASPTDPLWRWWNEDPFRYHFFCTVRHHGEVLHSMGLLYQLRTPAEFLGYLYRRGHVYRHAHSLFPALTDAPDCSWVRFERIVSGLNTILGEPFDEVTLEELSVAGADTVTPGKHCHWSEFLSRDVQRWMVDQYGREMELLGYSTEVP